MSEARVPVAVGALVLVALVVRWLSVHPAFFVQDDFAYLLDAQNLGDLDGGWLAKTWFGHLAPLHRLTFSALAPTETAWDGLLVVQLALIAASCWLFYRSLEMLFGRSWWLVPAVTWLAFSSVLQLPLLWPSAGVQQLPDLFTNMVALYAYLRFVRDGGRGWAVLGAACLAVALLFYIRPLLVPVYLLLLRVFVLPDGSNPRALVRTLWSERLVWGGYAVVGAVYLVFFFRSGASAGDVAPTASQTVDFLRIAWLRTLSFTLLGQTVPGDVSLSLGQHAVQVLAQLVVVALAVVTVLRKRAALRAWAYLAGGIAVTLAIIAYGRLGVLGPGVAYELRYFTNVAWLVPLGLLFAFDRRSVVVPGGGAPVSSDARRQPRAPDGVAVRGGAGGATLARRWSRRSLLIGTAGAVALIAYASGASVTARNIHRSWFGDGARQYVENLRASTAKLGPRGTIAVMNGQVPSHVIGPEAFPAEYSSTSSIASLVQDGLRFDDPRGPRYLVQFDGQLVAGRYRSHWRRTTWSGGAQRTGGAPEARVVATRGGKRACLRPGTTGAALLELRLPRPVTTKTGGIVVRIRVAGPDRPRGPIVVFLDDGRGYPAVSPSRLRLPADGTTGVVDARAQTLTSLRIDAQPGQPFCISSVDVGTFEPVRGRGVEAPGS